MRSWKIATLPSQYVPFILLYAGYMLEADPEKRPNIWQVSDVVCRMQGKQNILPNVFVSREDGWLA